MSSIDKMIDATVKCSKCGKPGYMTCKCWEKCECGWTKERGKKCDNESCDTIRTKRSTTA